MLKISFAKFQATGNDFVLIDNRDGQFPVNRASCKTQGSSILGIILAFFRPFEGGPYTKVDIAPLQMVEKKLKRTPKSTEPEFCNCLDSDLIRNICHRQFGVGADGIILLEEAEKSTADFQMRIFNSDGGEAASCGNGLRCLVRFLHDLGIVQKSYRIKTKERIVIASLVKDQPVIDMGAGEKMHFEIATEVGIVHSIDTGVPHAVQFVHDVDQIDLPAAGAYLRRHLEANVNFATVNEDGSIRVRTFERGIEGETLSCGTGAAAVAAVASRLYGLKGPIPIHTRGGSLEVWEEEGRIFQRGPAEKVFTGSYTMSSRR
jgi:diaminopimelate epimerase